MPTVLLVLHLMIAAGLVGVVLLQRSEGGGLGMGGGGGGFMTGRGTANLLTRVTAGLAALFFITSISLTLLAKYNSRGVSPLDLPQIKELPKSGTPAAPAPTTVPGAPAPAAPEKGASAPQDKAAPAPATPAAEAPASPIPTAPANKSAPPPKSQ